MAYQAPPCDVCGKPATSMATDILSTPNYETGLMEFAPIGGRKVGCNDHPAQSVEHESSGVLTPADALILARARLEK